MVWFCVGVGGVIGKLGEVELLIKHDLFFSGEALTGLGGFLGDGARSFAGDFCGVVALGELGGGLELLLKPGGGFEGSKW